MSTQLRSITRRVRPRPATPTMPAVEKLTGKFNLFQYSVSVSTSILPTEPTIIHLPPILFFFFCRVVNVSPEIQSLVSGWETCEWVNCEEVAASPASASFSLCPPSFVPRVRPSGSRPLFPPVRRSLLWKWKKKEKMFLSLFLYILVVIVVFLFASMRLRHPSFLIKRKSILFLF